MYVYVYRHVLYIYTYMTHIYSEYKAPSQEQHPWLFVGAFGSRVPSFLALPSWAAAVGKSYATYVEPFR